MFGHDETILRVNPYCRTDAILRVDDLDRYDDRDFVETNLLDTYHRLFDFVKKHTKDRFLLEDGTQQRVSARNIMARELIINMLIHRDIMDGHLSRIIIYKDKLVCENPNGFKTMRLLTKENYTPFAKNPTLAKFFREIGYADELGSGVKKITKYSLLYSGSEPIFEDKEMFRVTVSLNKENSKTKVKRYARVNDSVKVKKLQNDIENDSVKVKNLQNNRVNDSVKVENIQNDIENDSVKVKNLQNDIENDSVKMKNLQNDRVNDSVKMKNLQNDIENDSVKVKNLQNDSINDTLNSSEIKILTLINENNELTGNELSKISSLSISQISRILKSLKEKGYIKRIGSDKTGYWQVLK